MNIDMVTIAGFIISVLFTFLLSLYYIALDPSSKIFIRRFLEKREKHYRLKALAFYDDLKIAVGFLRIVFLVAFFSSFKYH